MAGHIENQYKYADLHYPDSIRVLHLLPGNLESEIKCKLVHIRQSDLPQFEAVSYAWGTPILSKKLIEVETDTNVYVTEHLYNAMVTFRLPNATRILWIDAICIDQTSNSEKTQQVAQMSRIYSEASRVLVWLGRMNADIAFNQLEQIVVSHRFFYDGSSPKLENPTALAEFLDYRALQELFKKDWFQRIWVVQEFALARDVIFFADFRELHLDNFLYAAKAISILIQLSVLNSAIRETIDANSDNYEKLRNSVFMVHHLIHIRQGFRENTMPNQAAKINGNSLVQLCRTFERLECTLPRDRMYGMLGLLKDNLVLVPDYDCSDEQVWKNVAISMLTRGDLSFLQYARLPNAQHSYGPSWAPSLRDIFDDGDPVDIPKPRSSQPHWFKAGIYSEALVEVLKNDKLRVHGIDVDRVGHCISFGKALETFQGESNGADAEFGAPHILPNVQAISFMQHFYNTCLGMFAAHPTAYEESFHDIFARTICLNFRFARLNINNSTFERKFDIPIYLAIYLHHEHSDDKIVVSLQKLRACFGRELSSALDERLRALVQVGNTAVPNISTALNERPLENNEGSDFFPLSSTLKYRALGVYPLEFRQTHSVFVTSKGFIGFGPEDMQKDDLIVVLDGADTPFVMRPWPAENIEETSSSHQYLFKVVGPCYLHGWMDGGLFGHDLVDENGVRVELNHYEKDIDCALDTPPPSRDGAEPLRRTYFDLC